MCDENLRGKKLLILAGAEVHCKVVRKAKAMGIYTIVTDYLRFEDSPAKQISDEYWDIDIMDTDSIIAKCRSCGVDGVLAFCIDPAQIPYFRICDALGVPCYGTKEQFEIMTSKRLFKKFCSECGVDTIPEYRESDIPLGLVKYPIFVKPSESRGSRGQSVCYTQKEAITAIRNAKAMSLDGQCIIEQYMEGKTDISLAYIVIDSVGYLTKIGDRYLGLDEDGLSRQQICTLLPSKTSDLVFEKVDTKVKCLIEKLGLKFGPLFLQGFIDDDSILFYDPGLRFPGSDYDVALEKATGFSTVESLIKFALTGSVTSCAGNPKECFKLDGRTAMILSISARPGKIYSIQGLDQVLRNDNVLAYFLNRKVGDTIEATGDIQQRVIEFVALVDNREEAENLASEIYSSIKIVDVDGVDMCVSKMGIDISFRRN